MPRPLTGRLVVATHNAGKVAEIGAMLARHGVEAVAASDLGLSAPDETGFTFAQNAAQKARLAARATGLPALADDSGLCVDALDGAPGLHTAEWAGVPRDYPKAMAWLDRELARRGVATEGASARAVCAMVVAWPDGHEELFEGRCYGRLAWPVRGSSGFGFDPIFRPEGHDRTFGEMGLDEKEGGDAPLSHRARAFAALVRGCLGGTVGSPEEPPRAFAREVAEQVAG